MPLSPGQRTLTKAEAHLSTKAIVSSANNRQPNQTRERVDDQVSRPPPIRAPDQQQQVHLALPGGRRPQTYYRRRFVKEVPTNVCNITRAPTMSNVFTRSQPSHFWFHPTPQRSQPSLIADQWWFHPTPQRRQPPRRGRLPSCPLSVSTDSSKTPATP